MMTYSNSKTKQRILDVAVTYFTLYGYEGTNLEDIGKALGLSRGPLYYYFKNKNDLYLAAIRYQMEISSQDLQRIYAEDLDVFSKICRDLAYCTSYRKINRDTDHNTGEGPTLEKIAKYSRHLFSLRKTALTTAQAQNIIRPDANLNEMTSFIYLYYYGIQGFNHENELYHMLDFNPNEQAMEIFRETFIAKYAVNPEKWLKKETDRSK